MTEPLAEIHSVGIECESPETHSVDKCGVMTFPEDARPGVAVVTMPEKTWPTRLHTLPISKET
jgi:hypothetical protein